MATSKTGESAKLPDDIVCPLVAAALKSNVTKYRGYVLDAYPTNFKQAVALFSKLDLGEDEEEAEVPEGEEDNRPRKLFDFCKDQKNVFSYK